MVIFLCNQAFNTSCGEKRSNNKLLLNEVLITNEGNYQDDYGLHSAWIEIFNRSYGSADLAACLLRASSQPGDTTTYFIPKGDVLTLVKPRQHSLFWADGEPRRGTFHTNFTLDPESNAKMEKFEEHDSNGIGMSISAMSVVFCGLILLFIAFKIVGKASVSLSKRNAMKAKGITDKQEAKEKKLGEAPGEIFAAIAMAMHEMQSDVHDVEDTVLTITRVKRSYSPWSSKIYTLRETPLKK